MKILIADDHAVVRRGLKQILSEEPDMLLVGEAPNGSEALNLIREQDWDVVVLDINMPGQSGLDILKELKSVRPRLPVLILSIHPEDQYAVRALKAGASGYLTKESAPEELVKAIRKVSRGGRYISPSLAEKLAIGLDPRSEKPLQDVLSDREFWVMRRIASGKTVSEIAQELSLSVKTISTYRARILEKLGMKTNAEMIHFAIKNRLVE